MRSQDVLGSIGRQSLGTAEVSYDSVRRLLKKHGAAPPVPFRRMESPPGFEAQVDFGTGAPVIGPDARRSRPRPACQRCRSPAP